jgi:hypothetical protein
MLPHDPSSNRPIWFPAKRYGWGWGLPIAWQGWVVLIVWLLVMIAAGPLLVSRSRQLFGGFAVLMLALLIAIAYARGERPRWRWGK